MRWQLLFICSYTLFAAQCYKCARNFSAWIQSLWKVWVKSQKEAITQSPIMYWILRGQLCYICSCSAGYTMLQTVQETSLQPIYISSEKASEKPFCAITNRHLFVSKKMKQKRTMLCSCCGWQKGMFQDEVTLGSEEIPFHCWVMLGWRYQLVIA